MSYEFQNYAIKLFARLYRRQLQYTPPQLLQLNDIFCSPLLRIDTHKLRLQGGLYFKNGRYIPSSGLITNGEIIVGGGHISIPDSAPTVSGNSLYLGICHTHFGHFLAETFSRLWFLNNEEIKSFDHIILLRIDPIIPQFVLDLFELLGVKSLLRFVDEPMFLENVCVSAAAIEYPQRVHQVINNIHRLFAHTCAEEKTEQVVFLSRSQLVPGHCRVVVGEDLIEQALQTAGVRIFHPQNCSIYEQIATLRRHKTVIGFAGSAFHTLILSGGNKKIIAYSARKVPNIFPLLDTALNNQSTYLEDKRKSMKGLATLSISFRPQLIDPKYILDELKRQRIIQHYDLQDYGTPEFDARQVKRYNTALLLRWVLEASQSQSEETCHTHIKTFISNHPLDDAMLNQAKQGSELMRRFF